MKMTGGVWGPGKAKVVVQKVVEEPGLELLSAGPCEGV